MVLGHLLVPIQGSSSYQYSKLYSGDDLLPLLAHMVHNVDQVCVMFPSVFSVGFIELLFLNSSSS